MEKAVEIGRAASSPGAVCALGAQGLRSAFRNPAARSRLNRRVAAPSKSDDQIGGRGLASWNREARMGAARPAIGGSGGLVIQSGSGGASYVSARLRSAEC